MASAPGKPPRREPKAICQYPGCNALIANTEPRCAKHPYPRRQDMRPSASFRGYDQDWKRLRARYIAAHPICQLRKRCRGAPSEEVDHLVPITRGGERLDWANLQALCGTCHRWKTAKYDKPGIPFVKP